ncbi:MAG: class E sortase [Acidimicrobiia bacterium]|nr:class E sortase [Acidimicrobiia bacterium]
MVRRTSTVIAIFAVVTLTAAAGASAATTSPEALWAQRLQSEFSLDDPTASYKPSAARQSGVASVQELGTPLGAIRIPAIDLDDRILAGVSLSVIDEGVAHWVGTSSPGGAGNMVLAGHRTTHSAPFNRIDELEFGDMMYFSDAMGREVMYKVTETLIVDPDDIWITYETGEAIATLFACHPKGSARHRIVVRASLVGSGLIF